MLQIAILDDTDSDRYRIERVIRKYFDSIQRPCEIMPFSKSDELLWELEEKRYFDFFFLDMEMPDRTGLEVAHKIRQHYLEPVIIYVTNYLEYAVSAFEVGAYRYIPKTVLEEKLPSAIEAMLPQIDQMDQRAYVAKGEYRAEKIFYRNIFYIRKERKEIVIVHRDGECRERKTLQEFYEDLKTEEFFYIDKGCIVNVQHITSFQKDQLKMRDQAVLTVSRSRRGEVQERIIGYWEGQNP